MRLSQDDGLIRKKFKDTKDKAKQHLKDKKNKSESVEYEVNEEDKKYKENYPEFLKKVRQGGREYEITKDMSDREYVKHLKKTGNYKRKKNKDGKYDYNYSHHKQDEYKDKAKRYDDRIDKSVKDYQAKQQAQRDKIEKERKERSGPFGVQYKLETPKYSLERRKLIKTVPTVKQKTFGLVKKEHYSWRDSFDLDEMTIAQRNSKQNQNKIAAQNRAKAMAKDNIQKFGGTIIQNKLIKKGQQK